MTSDRIRRTPAALVLLFVALLPYAAHGAKLNDPYEVLAGYYDALGGLDRLRAERATYFEGTLAVAGLSGTIRMWQEPPDRSRAEIDLGVFRQTTGDNGDVSWAVDQNGKLRIERDEAALAAREVERRLAGFEQLDRSSPYFTLSLDGVETVDGDSCYVVRIDDSIEDATRLLYIDAKTMLLRMSVRSRTNRETRTVYSDYRDVAGILRPFREEVLELPLDQKQTIEITMFESDPEIDPAIFDPPEDQARDFRFTHGDSAEIPFQFIENHIFVPVTVGCRERLWVLDTGASMSVIDSGFAGELGLELSGSMAGEGAGNAVQVSFATLPPFTLSGVEFDEQNVAAIDIAGLFRKTSDIEIAGILGYDFLSRFVSRVDFAAEVLTLYDPGTFTYEGDGVVLDAPLMGNIFTVPVTVDGKYGGRWTLDLGASSVSFGYPFALQNGLLSRRGVRGVGFGAGGRLERRISRFESIEMAGFRVQRPVISLPVGEVKGAFGSADVTGNLGNDFLRRFVLTLDYVDQKVIVERGADFDHVFPRDRSGLALWRPEDDEIRVLFASPGTPADRAGFRENDVVVSVNGIPVGQLDGLSAFRELTRAAAETEYTVTVERDGKTLDLRLVLEDLL
jgi:hypothetical protein